MSPALISQDGRWWWDGTQWRSRLVDGRLDLFWFTSTPDWFERVLVTGLIALIPIVGAINLYGWSLAGTDMVRRSWRELPPAGFQHLERGLAPFVVGLVYGLMFFLVFGAIVALAVGLLLTRPVHVAAAIALFGLAALLGFGWWLVTFFVIAAILVGSDRLGIGPALDPRTLIRIARSNPDASLHAGLVLGLGALALGLLALVVGLVIPFGGILATIGLPAIYAMAMPRLAAVEVASAPAATTHA